MQILDYIRYQEWVTEFHILTTEILKDEVEFSTSLKGIN